MRQAAVTHSPEYCHDPRAAAPDDALHPAGLPLYIPKPLAENGAIEATSPEKRLFC
jgi:hypothetical protein